MKRKLCRFLAVVLAGASLFAAAATLGASDDQDGRVKIEWPNRESRTLQA